MGPRVSGGKTPGVETKGIGGKPGISKIERWFGKYTVAIIVGTLFLFLLIGFCVLKIVLKDILSDALGMGFIGLLSFLGGLFAGKIR